MNQLGRNIPQSQPQGAIELPSPIAGGPSSPRRSSRLAQFEAAADKAVAKALGASDASAGKTRSPRQGRSPRFNRVAADTPDGRSVQVDETEEEAMRRRGVLRLGLY